MHVHAVLDRDVLLRAVKYLALLFRAELLALYFTMPIVRR